MNTDSRDVELALMEWGSERHLVRRVIELRHMRGWTQQALAERMKAVGCPIPQSAISRLEKDGTAGRAVSADEALGFAKAFDVPLHELLLPPQVLAKVRAVRDIATAVDRYKRHIEARDRYDHSRERIVSFVVANPEWAEVIKDELEQLTTRIGRGEAGRDDGFRHDVLGEIVDAYVDQGGKTRNDDRVETMRGRSLTNSHDAGEDD